MKWRAPILFVVFLIGGLVVGVPAGLAIRKFGFHATPRISAVAALAMVAVSTLMLSQSLAAATETLYARGDLDLLFSSPVAPRRVLFAKCAGIAANTFTGFALLVTPFVVPVAILARPAWLAVYPVLASLALLATSAGLLVAIALFRVIGPKRTRTVSQLLAVFVGASIFLVAQSRNLVGRDRFAQWLGVLSSPTGVGDLQPMSWPIGALDGQVAILAPLVLSALAAFAAATFWTGRRFAADAAAASGAAVGGPSRRSGEGAFAAGVFRATFRKELRLLRRDIPLLAQVLLRVVYLLPLTFLLLRNAGGHGAIRLAAGVGSVAFMCGQVAGSLVWLTVSAEDAPDLIGCAPASAAAIRRAKLCAALAPLAALMTIPIAVLLALSPLAGLAAAGGCVAAALSSALIGLALQKPAKRSAFRRRGAGSLVAALAEFGAGAVVAAVAGFAVVWPPLVVVPIVAAALLAGVLWHGDRPRSLPLPKAPAVVQ